MGRLPSPRYADSIRTVSIDKFGGYVHREGAGDGVIYDERNMWGGAYPCASSRPQRKELQLYSEEWSEAKPMVFDFTAWDGVFYLLAMGSESGCALYRYRPDEDAGPVFMFAWTHTDSTEKRHWVKLGDRLVIFPDGVIYDRHSGEVSLIAVTCNLGNAVFSDGTYAGISAKANTVETDQWNVAGLNAGDAVTITGCITHPENNTTLIIREKEIIDGTAYLRFYENSFEMGGESSYTEGGSVTVSRLLPQDAPISFACECGGRIWAAGGNYIFASAQNDPFNWNVFDGLPGDSWASTCPGGGNITGCVSYLGYPTFFKENGIYRILGDTAEEFTIAETQCMGMREGCEFSPAIAGGALFYNSKSGIMRYTGGMPQAMYFDFGRDKYRYAVGGSDGIRYYVKLSDANTGAVNQVFMYDTELGMWFRFDTLSYQTFSYDGTLWAMNNRSQIFVLGEPGDLPECITEEGAFDSEIVFTDFTGSYHGRKGVSKLHARVELEEGSVLQAYIRYDSTSDAEDGWELLAEVTAETDTKKTYTVPLIPRRCDHFTLKLAARGQWKLYQLTYEAYRGSTA